MKTIAILQSNYIPWKGYLSLIDLVDEFVILDDVQFTKNDWRNRNRIKTKNGTQWLTIPVHHERLDQKISDVKVADRRWARKHWTAWDQNYSKAPHFDEYAAVIEESYKKAGELDSLSEINVLFLRKLCEIFGIDTKISSSTDYGSSDDRIERLLNICSQSGASHYVSGPAAKSYLDTSVFNANGVTVQWMDYSGFPAYGHTIPPFEHPVSMLDLLFHVGSQRPQYFRKR